MGEIPLPRPHPEPPSARRSDLFKTWHQLRHMHAFVLHDIGVPAKIAQQQL